MNEQEIQNAILYQDAMMIVLNKQAGIACHQGPSGGDYLERYFQFLQFGLPNAPALAHRLDRDTSGCLILGRHRKALARLGTLFANGSINKKYWAICHSVPGQEQGTINAPILKVNTKRGWRIVIDAEKGQQAITDYRVLARSGSLSLIEASPKTGRTHQIRIHLKSIGCPIIGDPFYGNNRKDDEMINSARTMEAQGVEPASTEMLNLHARSVEVPLYPNRDPKLVEASPPQHMLERLKLFGY